MIDHRRTAMDQRPRERDDDSQKAIGEILEQSQNRVRRFFERMDDERKMERRKQLRTEGTPICENNNK